MMIHLTVVETNLREGKYQNISKNIFSVINILLCWQFYFSITSQKCLSKNRMVNHWLLILELAMKVKDAEEKI